MAESEEIPPDTSSSVFWPLSIPEFKQILCRKRRASAIRLDSIRSKGVQWSSPSTGQAISWRRPAQWNWRIGGQMQSTQTEVSEEDIARRAYEIWQSRG